MKLAGKSHQEIAHLTRNLTREQLVEELYQLATLEPHYSPGTIAAAREMSKRKIVELIQKGVIPGAHKPLENGWRVSHSGVRQWDAQTQVTEVAS